jgi:hypothetical protein
MASTDRHAIVKRDLADKGIDLDALVLEARAEGLGWRGVAAKVVEAGGYPPGHPTYTTVRRWYVTETVAAA